MTDINDPSQFRQISALRDGRPVLIRAARADDRERLVTALQGLKRRGKTVNGVGLAAGCRA
jgi:hypothetical protein